LRNLAVKIGNIPPILKSLRIWLSGDTGYMRLCFVFSSYFVPENVSIIYEHAVYNRYFSLSPVIHRTSCPMGAWGNIVVTFQFWIAHVRKIECFVLFDREKIVYHLFLLHIFITEFRWCSNITDERNKLIWRQRSRFVFGRGLVRISAGISVVPIEVFVVSFSYCTQMSEYMSLD
jgi:hypothetical protein